MDIGTLRGLGTALIFVAFVGLVFWAYNSKRKSSFDEAANLPFADEEPPSSVLNKDISRSNNQ
ncbi:MAG: cbb3-type cytochrome c oxidase subunit 3 [Pseudomonas sp.]|jgi:cytochrome c oxidase cbb3-type subunit 4|nr:cbb3-type cytochrome c oxidase subunit 3 [Pseudomonas sp.]MDD2222280.1 cbb3-type cytochrome c oxidase subunit 3 [Pseudomonas sp.]MDY0414179.1 cbb3-type cytochrome c oxidase subunit 3 [Pseudomonas sp.]NLO54281.1 cbb3-type cytochrome c oxidase subunit 3 [Gammaproteobacteria bacterium]